jgi:hypothetical protein
MRPALVSLVLALAAHFVLHARPADGPPGSQTVAVALERFLADSEESSVSYRALRTLEATARGGRMRARLTAWTSLDPDTGFQYSIVNEDGSGVIRSKVLRAVLAAEQSMRARGELGRGALTPMNYEFMAGGVEDGLVRIDIRPKRRDTMLVEGSILLTAGEGDLTRVERTAGQATVLLDEARRGGAPIRPHRRRAGASEHAFNRARSDCGHVDVHDVLPVRVHQRTRRRRSGAVTGWAGHSWKHGIFGRGREN